MRSATLFACLLAKGSADDDTTLLLQSASRLRQKAAPSHQIGLDDVPWEDEEPDDVNTLKDEIDSQLRCIPDLNEGVCACREKLLSSVCAMRTTKRFADIQFENSDEDGDGQLSEAEMRKQAHQLSGGLEDEPLMNVEAMNKVSYVALFLHAVIDSTDQIFGQECASQSQVKDWWNELYLKGGFDYSYLNMFCDLDIPDDEAYETVASDEEEEEAESFLQTGSSQPSEDVDHVVLFQNLGLVRHDADQGKISQHTRIGDYLNYSAFSRFTRTQRVAAKEVAYAGVAKSFAALLSANFCYKDIWLRPVRPRVCKSGWYQGGSGLDHGLCYQHCSHGYGRFGDHCWEHCPSGMNNLGTHCQREHGWFPRIEIKWKNNYYSPGCSYTRDHCSTCPSGHYAFGAECYQNRPAGYRCRDSERTCDRICTDGGFSVDCGAACAATTSNCVTETFNLVQGVIDAVVNTGLLIMSFGAASGAVMAQNIGRQAATQSGRMVRQTSFRISQSAFRSQVRRYRQRLIQDAIRDNMQGRLDAFVQSQLVAYAFSEADTLTEFYIDKFQEMQPNQVVQSFDITGLSTAIDGSTGDETDDAHKQAANWLNVAAFVDPTGILGALSGFLAHGHCEAQILRAENEVARMGTPIVAPTAALIGCFGNLLEIGSHVEEHELHTGPLCSSFTCPEGFIKTSDDYTVCESSGCSTEACCEQVVEAASWGEDLGPELLQTNSSQNSSILSQYNLNSGWSHGPGDCNTHGGVTTCSYSQQHGWHRLDVPTYSAGIASGRTKCGEEASRMSNAIGAKYMHLWGWHYCVVFFPPGMGCPSNIRGGYGNGRGGLPHGWYQEYIGRNGHGPLTLTGNTANHAHCFYQASC